MPHKVEPAHSQTVLDRSRPWTVAARLNCHAGLDVGVEIDSNIGHPMNDLFRRWMALEPGPVSSQTILVEGDSGLVSPRIKAVPATLESVAPEIKSDTIVYMDVLEHIAAGRIKGVSSSDSPGLWRQADRACAAAPVFVQPL
jgi:hypothetical protein